MTDLITLSAAAQELGCPTQDVYDLASAYRHLFIRAGGGLVIHRSLLPKVQKILGPDKTKGTDDGERHRQGSIAEAARRVESVLFGVQQRKRTVINKKNLLGKRPHDLGDKDAIHVAIVAVRAGLPIAPGQRCGINEFNEAVPDPKGVGVADPFIEAISVGDSFWLLLSQDAVPNVQHVWQHESISFAPPTRPVKRNWYLEDYATKFGVTYQELLDACAEVASTERPAAYPATGTRTEEEFEERWDRSDVWSDVWYEWSKESGFEFDNEGTDCCPEYRYPSCSLFDFEAAK